MTHEEFLGLVNQPEMLGLDNFADLREMVERYPYFVPARILLLKLYQSQQDIHFDSEARKTSLYVQDRRWLYYFLHPEHRLSQAPVLRDTSRKTGGDYFELMNSVGADGEESKHLLSDLVTKLKSARKMIADDQPIAPKNTDSGIFGASDSENFVAAKHHGVDPEQQEIESITLQIKKLISSQRYQDAIDILEAYNLNNPKKSVYFADQIRFLKKVIAISK